jgi:hypothetical protein
MQTSYFLPNPDDQRDSWDGNFAAKLPLYAKKYGITDDEVEAVQSGSAWFTAILEYQR